MNKLGRILCALPLAAVLSASVLLAGCSVATGEPRPADLSLNGGGQANAIPFTSVASSQLSHVMTPKKLVIRDQAAWEALWAEHTAGSEPAPPLPRVDFARRMLVAVFAGRSGNSCDSLGIGAITADAGRLVVEVDERNPGANVMCALVTINPMQVVALERSDADVDFVARADAALLPQTRGRSGLTVASTSETAKLQ